MRIRLKVIVMARPRASDYEDKSKLILDRSAILFARHGYDRASITMIADACGMSKALLYHYYGDKLQILLGIIGSHLDDLLRVTAPERCAGSSARSTLYAMSEALLDTYRNADAHHQVQLNHMDLLAPEQQDALRDLERRLVARFAIAIDAALPSPGTQDALLKPLTMSLFGMFNWAYTWFRDTGPLTGPPMPAWQPTSSSAARTSRRCRRTHARRRQGGDRPPPVRRSAPDGRILRPRRSRCSPGPRWGASGRSARSPPRPPTARARSSRP